MSKWHRSHVLFTVNNWILCALVCHQKSAHLNGSLYVLFYIQMPSTWIAFNWSVISLIRVHQSVFIVFLWGYNCTFEEQIIYKGGKYRPWHVYARSLPAHLKSGAVIAQLDHGVNNHGVMVRLPMRAKNFFLNMSKLTLGRLLGFLFLGVKRSGTEADLTPI